MNLTHCFKIKYIHDALSKFDKENSFLKIINLKRPLSILKKHPFSCIGLRFSSEIVLEIVGCGIPVGKGQLISKCPFGVIVWTKISTKKITISALEV